MKSFMRGIRNLIYWFPVIWRDRNFDPEPVLILLRHKLKRMARLFREEGIAVDADERAAQMEGLIPVIDRLIAMDYIDACWPSEVSRHAILAAAKKESELIAADMKKLCDELLAHLLEWWD